jgi:hypothetical protein
MEQTMTTPKEGDRVRKLLREFWNGNQSQMSRDTNCAQATLSLIANGKKEPGKRVLTLIAAHPAINSDWVFHGKGEPYTDQASTAASETPSLPVADKPLPGLPSAHVGLLLDERQVVVPELANPDSYFLRLSSDEPISRQTEMQVAPGDRLLIDMTPAAIPKMESLYEKLCVVRHPRNPERAALGLVSYFQASKEDGPEGIAVDTFDLGPAPQEIVRKLTAVMHRGRQRIIEQYFRKVGKGENQRLEQVSQLELEPQLMPIRYEDILGICKMLIRKF